MKPFPPYPETPLHGPGTDSIKNFVRESSQRLLAWRNAVRAWVAEIPESQPLGWYYHEKSVKILTRNIGENKWRVTSFCTIADGSAYMPWSHEEYATREDAMLAEGRSVESFFEHFPGRILTEEEIKNGTK